MKILLKSMIIMVCITSLSSCVTTPRNYRPAGFQTIEETQPYANKYLYYANKLAIEDWNMFYRRFPEYWQDIQTAKSLGFATEYHPIYTAYAFRWTTLKKKKYWDEKTLNRLNNGEIRNGDNIFKVDIARGVPARLIWNNDFEILIYRSGRALIFEEGVFSREKHCDGCYQEFKDREHSGMTNENVVRTLGLTRQIY